MDAQETKSASETLFKAKDMVLSEWEKTTREKVPVTRDFPDPVLIDTMPKFLENLAEALDENSPRRLATEGCTIAQEHGGERARITHAGIADVLAEYQILRETVYHVLQKNGALDEGAKAVIQSSIDDASKQSALAYSLMLEGIRQQFLATLTHDLRGPLTAARANIEMITRYPERKEKHSGYAVRALDNLKRTDKMITDLLDVTRFQAGEMLYFEMEECDVLELILSSIEEFSTIYGNRFDVQRPAEIPPAWINREAIRRVLDNLVSNAVKYGNPHSPIKIRVWPAHGRLMILVQNEGPPIPSEEQETLFQAFRRTWSAQTSTKKGWGLGLALVRGVAEAHGGSIVIESSAQIGTRVGIDILLDARNFKDNRKQKKEIT